MINDKDNIVLIEDDVQIRRFVTAALDNERFQVYCAESGDQGLIEMALENQI